MKTKKMKMTVDVYIQIYRQNIRCLEIALDAIEGTVLRESFEYEFIRETIIDNLENLDERIENIKLTAKMKK